jgi:hypothetical protein
MAAEAAVSVLAHLPKPVACSARLRDDVLAVSCRPLAELPPAVQSFLMLERGKPFLWFVRDDHAGEVDTLPVACVGRGRLMLTVAEVERWAMDYFWDLMPPNGIKLFPGYGVWDLARESSYDSTAAELRAEGAVALIKFSSPADASGPRVVITGESYEDDTKLAAQQESQLVDVATDFDRSPVPLDSLDPTSREIRARFASLMRQVWQGRTMPPAVAVFVKRYGATE